MRINPFDKSDVLTAPFVAAPDPVAEAELVRLYRVVWRYNLTLELAHLVVIYTAIVLVATTVRSTKLYPRWVAWLGIGGGITAIGGLLAGELNEPRAWRSRSARGWVRFSWSA